MKKFLSIAVLFILTLHLTSCDDIDIMSPAGPAGMSAYELWVQKVDAGEIEWTAGTDEGNFFKFLQGKDGSNAYEVWKAYISSGTIKDPHNPGSNWDPNKNSENDYYSFLTGAKGDDALTPFINDAGNWQIGDKDTGIPAKGKDGKDGTVVTIGANGNWFIDGVDSGVPSKGKDGKDGTVVTIGANGNWFIDGVDSGIPSKGKDGTVVTIGANGNWFVDGADSSVPAKGKDGTVVTIGANGNWFIDGVDSGIPSKGKDGQNGVDGSVVTIGTNGNWLIDGVDSGVPSKGKDGTVVTIGANGNWFIDGVDSGIPSKGKDGQNGVDGSVVTIGTNGNWLIDGVDSGVPSKGKDGKDGLDGSVVTIGTNGNWFIDGVDSNVPSKGKDGKDGTVITIGTNGNWYIDGVDSTVPSKGKDGINGTNGKDGSIVTIGTNGNWYIDGVDSTIPSKGKDGINGTNGKEVTIGTNGNWLIGGADSGVPAKGKDGTNGSTGASGIDGTSAFDMWVEEVEAGKIKNKDGSTWPTTNITLGDFWDYLSGESAGGGLVGVTPLTYVKSEIDPNNSTQEIFEFNTDAGAIVTMIYGNTTRTGTADGTGKCTISFPNSNTGDIPVLVSAQAAGKYESTDILLSVRVRPATFELSNQATWYDPSGNPLASPNGDYRPNDPVPYISVNNSLPGNTVRIPFDAENVQDVVVLGGATTNSTLTVEWDSGSKANGYILLAKPNTSAWGPGSTVVTLQIISNSGNLSFIKIEAFTNY